MGKCWAAEWFVLRSLQNSSVAAAIMDALNVRLFYRLRWSADQKRGFCVIDSRPAGCLTLPALTAMFSPFSPPLHKKPPPRKF